MNFIIPMGVDNIGSNSPAAVAEGAHTLLDTFWPHIIAELGYIGSILLPFSLSFSVLPGTKILS